RDQSRRKETAWAGPGMTGSRRECTIRNRAAHIRMDSRGLMRLVGLWKVSVSFVVIAGCAVSAFAQQQQQPPQQEPATREAAIEDAQAEKAKDLHPYVPGKAEAVIERLEENLTNGVLKWHPFFDNAYAGGGFTLGAGYATHVSPYNILD